MSVLISDPTHYAPVTRPYRRWLAVSLALLIHLVVIGVVASWQFTPAPAERTSLDVVLVTRPTAPPTEAEAIADADQRAAGQQQEQAPAETRAATSDVDPATQALAQQPDRADPDALPAANVSPGETQTLPEPSVSAPPTVASAERPTAAPSASGRDLLAQATASIREQGLAAETLGPGGDTHQQAARRAAEARYIDDWTRRVEDYGNRVHPAPREFSGQLRIRVVVGRDGELRQAEVVQSSGHAELDQAALDTVHGAAPYRPFDPGMGDLDSLSITRVWRFGQGNHYGVR
ncbi:TonB family protein [Halomonas sp. TRM85114]|uniref:energy transducer TonB n=1 Tax=Halomonas jincaotanensis TaxID=2810616 RepID=UPI001BD50FE6|nr:energy transducer TonB [Halomonas jincaotanensis]MBS9403407.1 TonB family protein [Halomonas jincaotanensis]